MSLFYDVVFVLFSIAYLPYLIFTGRYHKDIWQRFGFYPKDISDELAHRSVIWVHMVSVGEVMAGRVLCEALVERYPDKRLVVSTITKTGNEIAKRLLEDRATILYLPVDISVVVNKVFDRIRLEVFVIIETEIWPNLILTLHKKEIPVILANGRISSRSYGRYRKIKFLMKGILDRMTLFCMQSGEYSERIERMGAPPEKISVTGNMKFDTAGRGPLEMLDTEAIRSDLSLKKNELLLIAGSTHRPEEEKILKVYRELLNSSPNLRLLIAPRHIERMQEIEKIVRRFGFMPVKTSTLANREGLAGGRKTPVLLLDIMGRLSQLFSAATIVFMGGSLMRKGGQNILEPAVFSKPILFGPHMFNFNDIAQAFLRDDAACMVKNEGELFKSLDYLLKNSQRRQELGDHARLLIEKNKGATERNLKAIDNILSKSIR